MLFRSIRSHFNRESCIMPRLMLYTIQKCTAHWLYLLMKYCFFSLSLWSLHVFSVLISWRWVLKSFFITFWTLIIGSRLFYESFYWLRMDHHSACCWTTCVTIMMNVLSEKSSFVVSIHLRLWTVDCGWRRIIHIGWYLRIWDEAEQNKNGVKLQFKKFKYVQHIKFKKQ